MLLLLTSETSDVDVDAEEDKEGAAGSTKFTPKAECKPYLQNVCI